MYRRQHKVLACVMQIFVSGCLSRTTVQPLNIAGPPEQVKTNSITEYMRAIYKISHEGAVQDSEAYDRLLKENAAIQELVRHVAQNPDDLKSKLQLAVEFADHGLNWRAYELLAQLDTALPADPGVALGLARIWDSWGDRGLAKQYAVRAIELDGRLAAAYDTLARVFLHANDAAGAISAFLKANELEPGNPIPLADAGYAFMLRGDWQHARIYLERAISLNSALPEANNNLAIVLAQLGDYDGALHRFSETNRPAAALNNLGVVYLTQHKPKEAMQAFEEALKAEPDYATAKNNLQNAPHPAPKPAKTPTPTIVQLTAWPAAKSPSTSVAATALPAIPAATISAAVPVSPAAIPAAPVINPAPSKPALVSKNSETPAAPANVAKPASPAPTTAAAVPVVSTPEVLAKPIEPIAKVLPRVSASTEPTSLPAAPRAHPAAVPAATSAPAPPTVVVEQSKSPEMTASIEEAVVANAPVASPSAPHVVEGANVPDGSKALVLASNGDSDQPKQEQTQRAKRAVPNAGFLLISLLGAVMGTAVARSRGTILGAALGPIIQVAVYICGFSS